MKSQAYFLSKKGNPNQAFELKSFEISTPKKGELLIEVEAFGLNYADVMARLGLYREAPPMPCVIGYEVVGKIIATGSTEDANRIGERVVAFTRFGGYANHVITQTAAAIKVGEEPANELLSLATQGVTAYYMANYIAPIHPGEHVLIHAAAGGVGTILIQLAKAAGGIVYAKVSSEEKCALTKKLGADYAINYTKSNYHQQLNDLLGENRLDVVYNPVGGSTYKPDMQLVGAGGKMIIYGGSELSNGKWGMLSQLNFVRKMGLVIPVGLMMTSKSIIGVNMLKVADFKPHVLAHCLQQVVSSYQEGKLKTQNGGEFNHTELAKAHALLESGKSMGKISVHW